MCVFDTYERVGNVVFSMKQDDDVSSSDLWSLVHELRSSLGDRDLDAASSTGLARSILHMLGVSRIQDILARRDLQEVLLEAQFFVANQAGTRKSIEGPNVAFRANIPETFDAAARPVEDECDAVDLYVGFPKSVAETANYGAFLQHEWQLIAKIFSEAGRAPKVPVLCEIKIFDDVMKTENVKLLERSVCWQLAIHGRSDRKDRHGDLVPRDRIRSVVNAVSIPVTANVSVHLFEDAEDRVRETSAYGVMSVDGSLQSATLSPKSVDHNNTDIFREYHLLAHECSTDIRIVRSHVFKFLDHIVDGCVRSQFKLGSCSTLTGIVDFLDGAEHFEYGSKPTPHIATIIGGDDLSAGHPVQEPASSVGAAGVRPAGDWDQLPQSLDSFTDSDNHLDLSLTEARRDRRKSRREAHHQRTLAARKAKRKEKKIRRRERLREERVQQQRDWIGVPRDAHIQKRDEIELTRKRLARALESGVAVCVDLGLCDHMNQKELGKLSSQIRRLYGINRKTRIPLDLNLINFKEDSLLYRDCVARNQGFENYQLSMYPGGFEAVVERRSIRKIIYLSPDAELCLRGPLDRDAIYVVGGLVDETVEKVSEHLMDVRTSLVQRQGFRQKLLSNLV
ncbi:uncharacterized protein LOC100898428 [Galendromus occidentalis]|uniref:Uncharacterized protein LOC100898428 n=1 Tax=Galendromus occidentalis TaxID=34638 RepID=A0AAJ7PA26_9ACAR|nr:uncharacterized protein LOC100898428 [Galendromus occidentalis]